MTVEGFKRKLTIIFSSQVEGYNGGIKNEMPKMPV
jgi:hypothetical protein